MLKVATVTREAVRNQLLLCFSFACGLRVTELASITIRDIMLSSGRFKHELTLRSTYTKNARTRTVPMSSATLVEHLEAYLVYRIENGIGTSGNPAEFRGLQPDMSVIFSNRGGGFAMARKKRVLESGEEEEYLACDSLEQLFRDLFGGGQAELKLVESDDPLEAGLEIYACPPGKRLSVMSLMSGGEQALTAAALIFGVFLANPAPVCVLDEVDAPLDDANVDRFCKMLHEMRSRTDTRFIVITHNPVTMSRMDRLYGVTMPERGMSQLVSVDLHQAEKLVA